MSGLQATRARGGVVMVFIICGETGQALGITAIHRDKNKKNKIQNLKFEFKKEKEVL